MVAPSVNPLVIILVNIITVFIIANIIIIASINIIAGITFVIIMILLIELKVAPSGALWRDQECIKFGIQKCKIYVPAVQDE